MHRLFAVIALLLLAAGNVLAGSTVTTVVSDPLTGVAIRGWDPVSFFTEDEPLRGSPAFEVYWQGVPWYFASAANRDVFLRAPDVYAPRFGGHCAMGIARNRLSDGDPRIFVLHRRQLYFFYSLGNREAFLLAPQAATGEADGNWTRVSERLITRERLPPASALGHAGAH